MGIRTAIERLRVRPKGNRLRNPDAFFAEVRKTTGKLDQIQVDTINGLLAAAPHWGTAWMAYGLATAWGEAMLRPIRERGSGDRNRNGVDDWFEKYDTGRKAGDLGNTPEADGDGALYRGRGLVQLTGRRNYYRAGLYLGTNLVKHPALALRPDYATRILVWGMEGGEFTGRALIDYLLPKGTAPYSAFLPCRRIINGNDKAAMFAEYALAFQKALVAGGWEQ